MMEEMTEDKIIEIIEVNLCYLKDLEFYINQMADTISSADKNGYIAGSGIDYISKDKDPEFFQAIYDAGNQHLKKLKVEFSECVTGISRQSENYTERLEFFKKKNRKGI